MPFQNPVVGGTTLVRPAIHSPNYVPGISGWSINYDGSAEFNNVVVRGAFEVDGTPPRRIKIYQDASNIPVIELRDSAGNIYTIAAFGVASGMALFAGTESTLITEQIFETGGRIQWATNLAPASVVFNQNSGFFAAANIFASGTETWHNLSYSNGWTDFGGSYGVGRYRITPDGSTQLSGMVKGGTGVDGTVIATLNASYRATTDIILGTVGGTPNKPVGLVINTFGQIKVYGVSAAPGDGVSLDGLSFPSINI